MHENLMRRMSADSDQPTFKFLHFMLPHDPYNLDSGCEPYEHGDLSERERYYRQSECTIRLITSLIGKLKALNIYDQTMIIVAADHGRHFSYELDPPSFTNLSEYQRWAPSLLLIKPTKPKWTAPRQIQVRSPFKIRQSWQRFLDSAYWGSRLEE